MAVPRYDVNKKNWFGPETKFHVNKHESFGKIILESLSNGNPDRVMQINGDTGETRTTGEIRIQTIRCAQNLLNLGCTQNDRIVVIARNHHNLTPLVLAALCIGTPIAPLDVFHVEDGISHILRRLEPLLIFCDTDVLLPIDKLSKEIGFKSNIYSVNGTVSGYENIEKLLQPTGREDEFICADVDDTFTHAAVISCSSGSTGSPKSVIMTHALFKHLFLSRFDRFDFIGLIFSSLYWFTGMWSLLNSAFPTKPRIFSAKTFSPELLFKLVTEYQIELFVGPPSQLQAIMKSELFDVSKLKTLKCLLSVGSFLPKHLITSIKENMPTCVLITVYGMTEIGGTATMSAPFELEQNPQTVGRLLPGMEAKIINVATEENCGPNEEGEIYLKASVPTPGYFRDEEATRDALDDDGFFRSGDLGYFDANGYLYVLGRKKEIFKNCGYSIWPDEIENILVANPKIKKACVVSVFDDKKVTELAAALVVRQEDTLITENDVYSLIAEKLADYKHLNGGVYFVDSLPMTPSGKVTRAKAKQIAQQFFDRRHSSQH